MKSSLDWAWCETSPEKDWFSGACHVYALPGWWEHPTFSARNMIDHKISDLQVVRVAQRDILARNSATKSRINPAPDELVKSSEKGGIFQRNKLIASNNININHISICLCLIFSLTLETFAPSSAPLKTKSHKYGIETLGQCSEIQA